MKNAVFITAVDTEVGKTLCACGLAKALREEGMSIGVYKPVLSGADEQNGERIPADAVMLKAAAACDDDIALINPYCFFAPVTPAHAACIENVQIDKSVLTGNYNNIASRYDLTIIEGAGGVMAPVTDDYLILDMIKDFGCGVIVVTDTALGRINHTLMTLKTLESEGIEIIGIIINRYPKKPSAADISLLKYIKIFSTCEILGVIPEVELRKSFCSDFVTVFKSCVDIKKLKRELFR